MLENENFHHLNAKELIPHQQNKSHPPSKENGPAHVPFSVHYLKGVISEGVKTQSVSSCDKVMEDNANLSSGGGKRFIGIF